MREIKFRAWDKDEKEMEYADQFIYDGIKGTDYIGFYANIFGNEDSFELMQYTGIKDKNGKEIYEGDIVDGNPDYGNHMGIVKFGHSRTEGCGDCGGDYFIGFYVEEKGIERPLDKIDVGSYRIQVIGNIYENPELLNNK